MLEKKISETTFITKICIIHMVYKIHKLNMTGRSTTNETYKRGASQLELPCGDW